jgi:carboxyl-terminal processing protease
MENQSDPKPVRKWVLIVLQAAIILLSAAVGYMTHLFIGQYQGEFGLLRQAQDILMANTILDVPKDPALEYGMIQGMLTMLNDPYTYFIEPAAHEVESDQLAGSFGGIGCRLERDADLNWRLYPLPDSPALAAGVRDGDILTAVDDLEITPETDDTTLLAALRGPVGEKVTVTIQRDDEPLTFTIEREDIPLPSVTWNLLPDAPTVGMIKVNRIAESTAAEIQEAVADLTSQGASTFILDLRDNGGGLVDGAVEVVRLFLSEGEIVHQQFKDQGEEVFSVEEPGPFMEVPLVVLINGNTASSAEIVAGALKAHQRAVLVGSQTYAKTTIQYIFDLQDSSSIHVTSGRWWIPGIDFPLQPDHLITEDPTGTEIIQTAIDILLTK